MKEVAPIQLRDPGALNTAMDILAAVQSSRETARPFVGAALDSLHRGDLDEFFDYARAAVNYTLTGKEPINAAILLINRAFALNSEGERQ